MPSTSTSSTSATSTRRSRTARRTWRSRRTCAAATSARRGWPRAATTSSPRRCSTSSTSTASSWSGTTSARAASSRCASCRRARSSCSASSRPSAASSSPRTSSSAASRRRPSTSISTSSASRRSAASPRPSRATRSPRSSSGRSCASSSRRQRRSGATERRPGALRRHVDAVVLEQHPADLLRALGGLAVALGGGDDRALHEDVPLTGEGLGVVDAGLLGEPAQERPDRLEVADARLADRALGLDDLEHHVDERAALEVRLAEPAVERVEHREQALCGAAAATRLALEPLVRPALGAAVEEREDQLVLRGEVAVERHLRDAALRDDPIDADGAGAVTAEELVCSVEDPLAGGLTPGGGRLGAGLHPASWYRCPLRVPESAAPSVC